MATKCSHQPFENDSYSENDEFQLLVQNSHIEASILTAEFEFHENVTIVPVHGFVVVFQTTNIN